MRAFIKEGNWYEFVSSAMGNGFFHDVLPTGEHAWVRNPRPEDPRNHTMLVITEDKEIHLVTPMGGSPFMETHEDCFKDLINKGWVEYRKGDFD